MLQTTKHGGLLLVGEMIPKLFSKALLWGTVQQSPVTQ